MSSQPLRWRLYSVELGMGDECVIELIADAWVLAIWQGDVLVVAEECDVHEVAVRLSDQIWAHLLERGWREVGPVMYQHRVTIHVD
jgi:hypothetical protein